MELEDGVVYQDDPGTSAMMSERVSGLASSIYREFERLIGKYDEDVVKELMPLVVAVLENLDSVFAENQEHEVELELLKEDNEQLITQYEREKALRKHAEERFMEFEDTHEQEKKDLQNHVDRMESHSRQLELKIKNYSDQISRLEERELELKKDFNTLHQRHSEMIHNYMEHVERIKMQQVSETSESSAVGRVRRERPLSLGIFPSSGRTSLIIPDLQNKAETSATEGWRLTDSSQPRSNTSLKQLDFDDPPKEREGKGAQDPPWGNSLADACKDELLDFSGSKLASASASSQSDVKREDGSKKSAEVQAVTGTRSTSVGLPENEDSSDVQDIIESTPELDLDLIGYKPCSTPTKGIENMAFDRNTNSLFEELSSAGTDLIGDVDEGADLLVEYSGMGREVENLIQENSQLLETKNALNVVNKDLILKVDELTCEKEMLQGELESVLQAKIKLEERNKEMEEELKKVRLEMEDVKQKSKDEEDGDVPTAQRKRFTRVEMARVLMERNQYKERLMELQEAVRWTEMIRASRENPALTEKKKSSIWQFFSRLFSSSSSAPTMKKVDFQSNMKYNSPGSLVKRSSTFSQFPTEKSKIFDFVNEGAEQCSSPSRKEQKKAQYQQVKAHMQKEDGRVTVHGWSLPGKHKAANGGQLGNKMNLPVPVYLRPLDHKDASMKLWCAAGVNMSGGRTFPPESKQIKGSQSSLDQLEQDSKDQEKEEKDVEEVSNRVWVCMSTHSSTKVLVLDATQPSDLLDSFYACNTHVVCIASVPGVLETDYPAGESIPQDPEFFQSDSVSLAGSLASVGSTGSDGTGAVEGVTAVPQTASSGASEQPTEYGATSESVQLSSETSPAKDGVPTAEEATEATEANAGVGEDGEEDQGTDPNQAGIYTEHVFTDPLGVGPTECFADETQRGSGEGGLTSQSEDLDSSEAETLRMSSALPTMWLGAQNGCLYVHSSVARWRKCLHAIKLKDSILSIVHVKGRVLVALADGTLAIFHRGIDDQWDLTNYHLLDLGRPHHSIRCMTVVHDKVWCGYRNKIYVIQPKAMRIEKSFDAHPRKESQVRQLAWVGDGIWVSIRLDSTLRLFHAHTYQHLQDVDIEPYVSKMLGTGKLGFSFVRITALVMSCSRLWVGTGNGVIISIPLSEANKTTGIVPNRPGAAVRVYGDESSDCAAPGGFVPYCSMAHAQLCFHGHREAVKFFVTVPGQAMPPPGCADSGSDDPASESSEITSSEPKTYLVMSGGEGYIDFRIGDEGGELDGLSESTGSQQLAPTKAEQSHLIVWQVTTSHD
ncbi:C-Jun-amino-terminal kinase-interacting protein 4 isoform X4 [Oryzias latipes]|uniref:C-Jun-amino-terminal kinase-interacting protein 4 isoform X4 n=1 Tax=Oryzias latipes TaxID=8090 RepID=UPI0009DB648A|nr:C-Jun-amino-terminal kinase-interacting protein 4 isoform X4 [Oryzias latipes]